MSIFKVVTMHPHSSRDKEGNKKWRNRGQEYDFEGSKLELDQHIANGILAEKKEVPTKESFEEKQMANLEKKGKGKKARQVKEGTYVPKKKKE